jgi:hypothetical protein
MSDAIRTSPKRLAIPLAAIFGCLAAPDALPLAAGDELANSNTSLSEAIERWLGRKILPQEEATAMMADFVEAQLAPIPLSATPQEWNDRREPLRREIHRILGLDDFVPPA